MGSGVSYRVCGLYRAALWGLWGPIGFGGSTGRPYGIQRDPIGFGAALWDLGGPIGFVGSIERPYGVWGVL